MNLLKRTRKLRTWAISLLMVVALLITNFYTGVSATAGKESNEVELAEVESGESGNEENVANVLSDEDYPEAVRISTTEAKSHVRRLTAKEKDLNSIVFQNNDGTKTLYYFAEPVKYVDENGEIQDKSNGVTPLVNSKYTSEYSYTNMSNDVHTYFPKRLGTESGVVLEYRDILIELFPIQQPLINTTSFTHITQEPATLRTTSKAVSYNNVFGTDTEIRYTPKFNGFKEEIC